MRSILSALPAWIVSGAVAFDIAAKVPSELSPGTPCNLAHSPLTFFSSSVT